MANKKAQDLSIGTLILIVLGIIVLVLLILGFSMGWSNLWEKINAFGGGKVNTQTIVQSCQLACTTNSKYDYCKTRKLIEDGPEGKPKDPRDVTCKNMEGATYGLDACGIDCGTSGASASTTGSSVDKTAYDQKKTECESKGAGAHLVTDGTGLQCLTTFGTVNYQENKYYCCKPKA